MKAKIISACVALVILAGCGSSAAAQGPEDCSPARPCGNDVDQSPGYGYSVVHVNVDGRKVTCIVVQSRGTAISCNWGPS